MISSPRILFVSRYTPVDSSRPGCPRIAHFSRELKELATLELAIFEPTTEISDFVSNSFDKVYCYSGPKEIPSTFTRFSHSALCRSNLDERLRYPQTILRRQKWLRSIILDSKIDLIFARGIETFLSLPKDIKIPVIVDFVDSLALLTKRESKQTSNFIKKIRLLRESYSLKKFETEVFANANLSLFISERDRQEVDPSESAKSIVVQNGVDINYYKPSKNVSGGMVILFFGVQSYGPNADATTWLIEQIAPLIVSELPQVQVRIVGPGVSESIKVAASQSPNVTIVGEVEDLRTEIWNANLFLCPLRFGAGMKNKILVALAGGLPIVATPLACEGMNLGSNVSLGSSAKELAELSISILKKPYLAEPDREVLLQSYTWAEKSKKLIELFHSLISSAN